MNWSSVAVVLLAIGGLAAIFTVLPPTSKLPEDHPSPMTRCRSLPTEVVNAGIQIHSARDALYLCFQQGGAQGMTEVVCTPMRECPR